MEKKLSFLDGIKHGLPICFAYISVAFTFGVFTSNNNLPTFFATLISGTNLTSAGQFAGVRMIISSAGYLEIAIAVFIINSRYMLMSLSLSQRLESNVTTLNRFIMSFFVTDEIFAVASTQKSKINFRYFCGLVIMPYLGWTLGTLLGASINTLLPESLQVAMGIALYCMFIAIIVPPAKTSKPIIMCILIAIALSCLLEYVPFLCKISFGFRVIISSVISASVTALIFPINTKRSETTIQGDKDGVL